MEICKENGYSLALGKTCLKVNTCTHVCTHFFAWSQENLTAVFEFEWMVFNLCRGLAWVLEGSQKFALGASTIQFAALQFLVCNISILREQKQHPLCSRTLLQSTKAIDLPHFFPIVNTGDWLNSICCAACPT